MAIEPEVLQRIEELRVWQGVWSESICRRITDELDLTQHEGIVVRPRSEYHWKQIADPAQGVMGKWVRKGHIQTDEHWMKQPVVWNELRAS